mmetsp:Transcript_41042/g.127912  ORF Transcript_41042/g.127912 Transcript_41042/m.127912 type:complete len:231 (+) Transcript_41042:371-1063(+)
MSLPLPLSLPSSASEGSSLILSSCIRATQATTSGSLLHWPPDRPCSLRSAFLLMMSAFSFSSSSRSALLKPADSTFLAFFSSFSFFGAAFVSSGTGAAAASASGTFSGACICTAKLPWGGGRPLTTLHASMYLTSVFMAEISLETSERCFLLSLPVNVAARSSLALIATSCSSLKAVAAATSKVSSSSALFLKSSMPLSACAVISLVPLAASVPSAMAQSLHGEGLVWKG